MNIHKLWNTIYQEEADGDAGSPAEGGDGDAGQQGSLLDGSNDAELAEGEYFLAEGVKGLGDVPEWYDSKRFKSVTDQAKSYLELEKKFGSFTGAPKDGYELPEGVDAEDGLLKEYTELASSLNMNQEGFNKGFELLSTQMQVNQEVSLENEMGKLGDNAQQRIKTVENILKNQLGDGYDEVIPLVNSADSVILVETLTKAFMPKKLPIDGGENPTGITWADIQKEMMRKDENGNWLRSVDREHENKIQRMMKEYGGDKPNIDVIG